MKKYYVGEKYLFEAIGVLVLCIAIQLIFAERIISLGVLICCGGSILGNVENRLKPVGPYRAFWLEGSIIHEELLFKHQYRHMDLEKAAHLYLWDDGQHVWLFASEEEVQNSAEAKNAYLRERALMIPVMGRMKESLQPWVEQAENIE